MMRDGRNEIARNTILRAIDLHVRNARVFFSFLAKFITHDITYGDTRVCLRDTCMQAFNLCVITPEDMPFTDVSRFFAIHMLTRVER